MSEQSSLYCPLASQCELYRIWNERIERKGRMDVIEKMGKLHPYSCLVIRDMNSPIFGRGVDEARNNIGGENCGGCSYVELLNSSRNNSSGRRR
jgi:hypothetical protein